MSKLISLDLDGTLLGPDGDLTPGAAGAIARAREAGLRVVLNTGRPMTEAGHFAREAGCDNLVSCLGGALLGDAQTGAELRRWDIPEPWGSRALEICLGRGLEITIFSGYQVVLDPFVNGDHNYTSEDPATNTQLDADLRQVTVDFLTSHLQ